MIIPGQSDPFRHTDRNRLRKNAAPTSIHGTRGGR
jgi:hypothetical protein